MAAEDLVTVTTYAKGHLANSPIEGYTLTGIKPELISVRDSDGAETICVALKAYGIRPAQKGQKELYVGDGEDPVIEDPDPVCLGELLVLDATTAIALAVVLDATADEI